MIEKLYCIWQREQEEYGGGAIDCFFLTGQCQACCRRVGVPETLPENQRKEYVRQHVQHRVSEEECWQTFIKREAQELGLGKNFQLYPDTATMPWTINSCAWGKFPTQTIGNFKMGLLRQGEQKQVAKVWAAGFPELFLGTYGFVLDPQAYDIFFGEEWRMFVLETTEGEIAGAWILRMDRANLSADFSLVVVHPDFRGQGLLKASSEALDEYLDACDVELATISCATFHLATRKVFRQLGFTAVGILPGAIRANVLGQFYRRDSVEMLYKLYRNTAMLVPPIEEDK